MNPIDLLILLIIFLTILSGWHSGFVASLLNLVRWVGTLVISFRLYPYLSEWLSQNTNWSVYWIPPISFFVIAMLSSILIQTLGNLITQRLPAGIYHSKVNKFFGTIPGFASGLVMAAIIAILLLALPLPPGFDEKVQASKLVGRFGVYSDRLKAHLAPVFDRTVKRTLNRITIAPESGNYIELPFTVEDYTPRPDLEQRMLELLNKERVAQGLKPLEPDTALTTVARQHSADMFTRGYFSHFSPEGASAADRVRSARIPYRTVGENLAMAPTLPIAHKGLMDSPGHRANILEKRFRRVGIGVLQGGKHGLMITQKFRN